MRYRHRRGFNWLYGSYGMWKDRYVILVGLLACIAVIGSLFYVGHEVEEHNCAMASELYHRDTVFDDVSFNCYVKTTDGRRVRLDTYITTHEERREQR